MTLHANIHEHRDGKFRADCGMIAIVSADPEHDLCHAFVKAGFPDGPIQFWRDGVPSLFHPSIHRMAKMRIGLGERFPMQRVKRMEWKGLDAVKTGGGPIPDGDLELP